MTYPARARSWARRWSARGIWLGPLAFVLSLLGTELLGRESARNFAVLLLLTAGVLAVLAWSDARWSAAFPVGSDRLTNAHPHGWRRRLALAALGGAMVFSAVSHIAFLAAPRETFGVAGWLWLSGIAAVIAAATLRPVGDVRQNGGQSDGSPVWTCWEVAMVASIAILALALRLWDLRDVPFNIYPDEIMTGSVAERAYVSSRGPAPGLFSTMWSDVELPALWFAIVAAALKLGGIGLATVRLPAALFGAATVLPFYGLMRGVWGRIAAIAGASIMAFSAANVHYSRMALNNITAPFFWTVCFFFLMRGLRSHRRTDWTLAGIAAGVSEHFYYGTRLLPFVLAVFMAYLLVVHWRRARHSLAQFGWLVLGYLIGFGPLLSYFITHPGLYYGRGAGLMTLNRITTSWHDLQQMWNTLWPIMSENLLGVSTQSAQDIMYYAPLLLPAEAALLVLGVALLVWRWRHPAAFLMLLSGLGVLFVGGTLILYPNSAPPMLAHWTPAFAAFYAAIAVPIGAWVGSTDVWLRGRQRWTMIVLVVVGLMALAYANMNFYFHRYYANPESLRNERYKAAQRLYEVQTIQSRYMASLGASYRVVVVGKSPYPYDSEITRYLVQGQEYIPTYEPEAQLSLSSAAGKGLAFLFFPENEQYQELMGQRYPGGKTGEVHNPVGRHVFYTYVVTPQMAGSDSQPR
jgi:4-amino-4-deoxy-L-arabinose transferase-like glycosyltransferase